MILLLHLSLIVNCYRCEQEHEHGHEIYYSHLLNQYLKSFWLEPLGATHVIGSETPTPKDCNIQGIRDGPHLNFYPSPVEMC